MADLKRIETTVFNRNRQEKNDLENSNILIDNVARPHLFHLIPHHDSDMSAEYRHSN